MAYYSRKRTAPTFKRVSSVIGATKADPNVLLIFTDGSRDRFPAGADVDVRHR